MLLDAARIGFTLVALGRNTRIVAGSGLSIEAIAALKAIGDIFLLSDFATLRGSGSTEVFVVSRLEQIGDSVHLEGTADRMPRGPGPSNLNCGIGYTLKFLLHADGWQIEDSYLRMC